MSIGVAVLLTVALAGCGTQPVTQPVSKISVAELSLRKTAAPSVKEKIVRIVVFQRSDDPVRFDKILRLIRDGESRLGPQGHPSPPFMMGRSYLVTLYDPPHVVHHVMDRPKSTMTVFDVQVQWRFNDQLVLTGGSHLMGKAYQYNDTSLREIVLDVLNNPPPRSSSADR